VTLSAFKFANQQMALDKPTADTTDPQNKNSNVNDFLLSVSCVKLILRQSPKNPESTQAGSRDFRRPEAYEQMATDKPGQELSHDAAIWKLYLEEADEHDQELVKGRDASLDMLLLFVRFSCFLTNIPAHSFYRRRRYSLLFSLHFSSSPRTCYSKIQQMRLSPFCS
jgi:hypothetical protein